MQFEDFNAFRLLRRYRDRLCCFDDDIQGTGAMGLAGLYSAGRITGRPLSTQRIRFVGAGQACRGMGVTVIKAMQREGLSEADARARCLFIDSRGPVVTSRSDVAEQKRFFAQDRQAMPGLVETIEDFRAHSAHWRIDAGRHLHAARARGHVTPERASRGLRPVEPNRERRMYRRAGVRLDRGTRGVRQRQSVRPGDTRRSRARHRPGEQFVRVPGRRIRGAGFLRLTNAGQYVRLTEGSATMPPLRMAKELNRSNAARLTA